jgi:hypothetical protein
MLRRVNLVVTTGEHSDSAAGQGGLMRGGIDAARQAGRDNVSRFAKRTSKTLREFDAGCRRIPRSHYADHGTRKRSELTTHADQWWRIVDGTQARGVVGLADCDHDDPLPACELEFSFGIVTRTNPSGRLCAAAAHQRGQRFERSTRATAVVDQGPEGARSDVFAVNQAEPVEPLLVGQADAG